MKSLSFLFALMGCAAGVAGCAPKKTPKPTVDSGASAAIAAANEAVPPTTPTGAAVGATAPTSGSGTQALPTIGPAPAWKLKDVNGNVVTSDQFKGKVIVVDFWATWCGPCRAEIPGYVELYKKYGKDRLAIVGVSLDEAGANVVADFAKKFDINYPVVMGDENVVAAFGGMDVIPTTFLIDRDGNIRDKKVGAEPRDVYEA